MTVANKKTIVVVLLFLLIGALTGYKHMHATKGFVMDREGNITGVDVSSFDGNVIVPSEIDGITVRSISLDGIKGLKSLELDQAMQLESVSLIDVDLEELDTSRNKKLTNLWIRKTGIKNLDVSNNGNLETLGCSDNLLETLDISANQKLSYVDCTCNPITALNIEHNPTLRTVYCDPDVIVAGDNNVVQHFDISQVKRGSSK